MPIRDGIDTADAPATAVVERALVLSRLSSIAGKEVRFRFTLKGGSLYAFWVGPDAKGASRGFIGAGGPGYISHRDTVGTGAGDLPPLAHAGADQTVRATGEVATVTLDATRSVAHGGP